MVKIFKNVSCCFLVFLIVISLSSCTLYEHEYDETRNIGFGYSTIKRDCFVGEIVYTENSSTEIVIPDKFNNLYVVQLGGYTGTGVPTPFAVSFDEAYLIEAYDDAYICEYDDIQSLIEENADVEIEDIKFKITLPRKLKTIKNTKLKLVQVVELSEGETKKIKVFKPVYYFEISEENETFYTKDGKLYYKETNELFADCIYE